MFNAATSGLGAFVRRHMPTRESVHSNRFLKPFAHRLADPALWRMHRRSVPRAVALGLGVGVIIPFMHMAIAALLAIPLRANVALAAGFTLVVNPLTIPPLYYAAYRTGAWELGHQSFAIKPPAETVSGETAHFLQRLHEASGPWALGILTIAIAAAVIGYAASALIWRAWLGVRWGRRNARDPAA